MILSSCGCKVSWALRGGVRLRRHKLHILRPAAGGRAHSFRCSSSPKKALRLSGDPFRFFGLQVIPTTSKCGVTGGLFATVFAPIPPSTGRENPPDSPGLSHLQICGFFDGDGGCGKRVLPANSPCPPATGACYAPVQANREKIDFHANFIREIMRLV